MRFYNLSPVEAEDWLVQHVPHRVCAALALLPLGGKWATKRPPLPNKNFDVWCIDRSIDEGRKAFMRWLIEFVGITLQGDKATSLKPHPNGKSVTIQQVGGIMFDPTHQDALKLAKIWQACTQASLHPTVDTNHDPLEESDLAGALQIVLAHLETGLYEPVGRDLCKIVHEQEELAILRAGKAKA